MIINKALRKDISELITELECCIKEEGVEIDQDKLGDLLIQIKHVAAELFILFRQNIIQRG